MSIQHAFDASLAEPARRLILDARAFARDQAVPAAAQWEAQRALPGAVFEAACRQGFGLASVPAALGGGGQSFGCKLRIAEELAAGDPALAFALLNHLYAMGRLAESASPALRDEVMGPMVVGRWIGCTAMTEPSAGSDFGAITTTAVRDGEGWRIDGRKAWVANSRVAEVFLVFSKVTGLEGTNVAAFVVRASDPGFSRGCAHEVSGIAAIGLGEIVLDGCRVAGHRLLYGPESGMKAGLRGLNRARAYVAAMQAGIADAALGLAVAHCARRPAFGGQLIALQGLRWMLADVATAIEALRGLAYHAAQVIDAGGNAQIEAALAKKFAGDHAPDCVERCLQAMGAAGLDDALPMKRLLVASRALCLADGATEVLNDRIARGLIDARARH